MATEALIPEKRWVAVKPGVQADAQALCRFAEDLRISPAIPAGRIRYEKSTIRFLGHCSA